MTIHNMIDVARDKLYLRRCQHTLVTQAPEHGRQA